jgi:DNA invertase Pin-like site-specific DNA recombinase
MENNFLTIISVAYSYIRFSHPEQARGDSLRRQMEAAAKWCQENKVRLDESLNLRDLGASAYTGGHRKNPDRHALAAFLKLVEQGKVPRGSYLILESLDRLTREQIQPALLLVLNLLQAGIRIVQLKPVEMIFDEKSDTLPVMMMMVELSRGHSESAVKSDRIGKAWLEKRKEARKNRTCQTAQLPGWLEVIGRQHNGKHHKGGTIVAIPQRAAAVRRIFELAAAGYSQSGIVRKLNEEGHEPFGEVVIREGRKRSAYSGCWLRAYVAKILHDRRTLGEYQPCGKDRKPDGPAIEDYYPAVITETEWTLARAGVRQRRKRAGRQGDHANLFAGLLHNARDGGTYYAAKRPNGTYLLVNTSSSETAAPSFTFPCQAFEEAVLGGLKEIDPQDILNGDRPPDETLTLAAEVAEVEARISELEKELLSGEVAALARVLRQLEERRRGLLEELAKAREKAANPLSEAWGEGKTLIEALRTAPDPEEARLRLRTVLRRLLASIWVLVVPRGPNRLCAIQLWFADEKRHRDYLAFYRRPLGNQNGHHKPKWFWRSFSRKTKKADLDLRDRKQALELAEFLERLDIDEDLNSIMSNG